MCEASEQLPFASMIMHISRVYFDNLPPGTDMYLECLIKTKRLEMAFDM